MFSYLKKHWLWIGIWLLLILPLVSFLLVSAGTAAYIFWPRNFDEVDLQGFQGLEGRAVILTHGVKDDARGWIAELKADYENRADQSRDEAPVVLSLDWSTYAQSSIRCAVDGRRIGQKLGETLARHSSLTSIHFVAHSCGAFVIYGACESLKAKNKNLLIQTTYLDPVSVYGLAWDYGIAHFGRCADYSEAYIDTGDTVPGSNERIPHAHTYDVTPWRVESGSTTPPHLSPIEYYRRLVRQNLAPSYVDSPHIKTQKPPRALEKIAIP